MDKSIDACGLSCPEPVLLARRGILALAAGEELEIRVDAGVARENVTRMAESMGCTVVSALAGGGVVLGIKKT